jgi:hypothetical protein
MIRFSVSPEGAENLIATKAYGPDLRKVVMLTSHLLGPVTGITGNRGCKPIRAAIVAPWRRAMKCDLRLSRFDFERGIPRTIAWAVSVALLPRRACCVLP